MCPIEGVVFGSPLVHRTAVDHRNDLLQRFALDVEVPRCFLSKKIFFFKVCHPVASDRISASEQHVKSLLNSSHVTRLAHFEHLEGLAGSRLILGHSEKEQAISNPIEFPAAPTGRKPRGEQARPSADLQPLHVEDDQPAPFPAVKTRSRARRGADLQPLHVEDDQPTATASAVEQPRSEKASTIWASCFPNEKSRWFLKEVFTTLFYRETKSFN